MDNYVDRILKSNPDATIKDTRVVRTYKRDYKKIVLRRGVEEIDHILMSPGQTSLIEMISRNLIQMRPALLRGEKFTLQVE